MRVPKPAARITAVLVIAASCIPNVVVAGQATPCQSLSLSCWFNSRIGVQHLDPHPAVRPRRDAGAFRSRPCGGAESTDAGAWPARVLAARDGADGGRRRGEADRA